MRASEKRIEKGMYWDRAWSLVEGCTKVSPGCQNCWSETQAAMRVSNPAVAHRHAGTIDSGKFNGKTNLQWADIEKPTNRQKPKVWSVWNDLFHESVTDEFISKTFRQMTYCSQHAFIVLTKRATRMRDFLIKCKPWEGWITHNGHPVSAYGGDGMIVGYEKEVQTAEQRIYGVEPEKLWPPPNVYIGVTAENQEQADKRIPILLQAPAAVRFVSVEPMLGPVRMDNGESSWLTCNGKKDGGHCCESHDIFGHHFHGIDWVICGGESGHNARPMHPDWARSLRDQCVSAGVSFFFKQWGNTA